MTSTPVTSKDSLLLNVAAGSAAGSVKAAQGSDFSNIMSQKTGGQNEKAVSDAGNQQKVSPKTNVERKSNPRMKQADPADTQVPAESRQDVSAEEQNAVMEKAEKVLGQIAEELGVSEEDLEAAMEVLGLQMLDLLQPEALTQLAVEVTGEGDILALVTNEELYQTVNDVLQLAENAWAELQEATGMSQEELARLVEQMIAEQQSKVEIAGNGQNAAEITTAGLAEEAAPLQETGKPYIQVETENTEEAKPVTKVLTEVQPEETQESVFDQESAEEGAGTGGNKNETPSFQQSLLQQHVDIFSEEIVNTQKVMEKADTTRIMQQIMDYMKVHISAEVTEMEMQLHPASLGNIHLQVAVKDGALTAQFTAQNEAVRAVIETQMVQLKENLNQQGIKVEAVEVTIASHGFERNLQEEGSRGHSGDSRKQGRRRITFDEMSAMDPAEMDEADRITVEMMEKNGNSVDFTA